MRPEIRALRAGGPRRLPLPLYVLPRGRLSARGCPHPSPAWRRGDCLQGARHVDVDRRDEGLRHPPDTAGDGIQVVERDIKRVRPVDAGVEGVDSRRLRGDQDTPVDSEPSRAPAPAAPRGRRTWEVGRHVGRLMLAPSSVIWCRCGAGSTHTRSRRCSRRSETYADAGLSRGPRSPATRAGGTSDYRHGVRRANSPPRPRASWPGPSHRSARSIVLG